MCSRASLNHTFRSVWNHALGAMVAVPENAASQGGGGSKASSSRGGSYFDAAPLALALCVALAWGASAGNAHANPTGGVAVAGQASMTTNANQLLVTTQNAAGTNYSSINWQSFSIPAGSSTYFQQPNAASTVINRVVTSTPSLIFGTLGSNGNLVLINQSGITVGAGAVVDTAGFTASALRMNDADALAGRMRFGDDGAAGGTVSVQGNVLARSGDVVLLAAHIETGKDALIQAPNGSTLLAAGQKIAITGRGLEGISLEVQAPTDSVVNLGTLKGDAVGIFASTLKHSGVIQANAVSTEGGKVLLKGGSALDIGGVVQAQALGQRGGSILASAQYVTVDGTAVLDASGALGGGEVLVGGGYQGHDARLTNAQTTTVQAGAQLRADAVTQGDGGTVVVWSDGATRYAGSLSARGGALGGNGGRAEVSGKQYLDFRGLADLRAPKGVKGNLLLDPYDLVIGDTANIDGSGYGSTDIQSGNDLSDPANYGNVTSYITASAVGTLLETTDVTLAATNDISINSSITKASSNGTTTSLALNAGHDIVFGSGVSISSSYDPLNVTLTAGNAISSSGGTNNIATKGGNISLTAGAGGIGVGYGGYIVLDTTGSTTGGNVSVHSDGAVSLDSIETYGQYDSSGGSVSIQAAGDVSTSYINTYGGGQSEGTAGNGGSIQITAGGVVSISNIDSSGGSASSSGVAGGSGGAVTIVANGASGNSYVSSIYAGGGGYSYGYGAQVLGAGGAVSVTAGHDLYLGDIDTNSSVTIASAGNFDGCGEGCNSIGNYSYSYARPSSISISAANTDAYTLPYLYSSGSVSVYLSGSGTFVFNGSKFEAASITLKTPNGSISQSGGFSTGQLTTSSAYGTTLTGSNTVSSFLASNSGAGNVEFTNTGVLSVLGISNAGGDVTLDNTGGITTSGAITAPNGAVTINAHSPITIGTGGVSAGGGITFTTTANDPTSNITLNGVIQSTGGSISFAAGNNLVQNSGVIAAGGITATAGGVMSFGPNGYSSGSPLSYTDVTGSISPPLVPLSALVTTGGTVADFLDQFLAAVDQQQTYSDDPFDPRNRNKDALVVEGQICTP